MNRRSVKTLSAIRDRMMQIYRQGDWVPILARFYAALITYFRVTSRWLISIRARGA